VRRSTSAINLLANEKGIDSLVVQLMPTQGFLLTYYTS